MQGTILGRAAAVLALLPFAIQSHLVAEERGARVDQGQTQYEDVEFGRLRSLARTARGHDAASVRAVVDEIFDGNLVTRGAPESLRERVTRADVELRRGGARGISSTSLAAAVNNAVGRLGLPVYYRTTPAQIRSFRDDYSYSLRDVALPTLARADDKALSPNEALFVVAEMALQKTLVEENQIPPEAWDARRRRREQDFLESRRAPVAEERMRSGRGQLTVRLVRQPVTLAVPDWSSDGSVATAELHRILDEVGIPR